MENDIAIQHKNIPDAQLHETKGAATASIGQLLVANGDGTATFQNTDYTTTKFGFIDVGDTATTGTPIALSVAGTNYQLTNNGLGAQSLSTYILPGTGIWWNPTTNVFDFSGLSLGDVVDIRCDLEITTGSVNNNIELTMELGIGGTPYSLSIAEVYYKTAGVHKLTRTIPIYIGNTNTQNFPARFVIKNDTTGSTVKVLGWFMKVFTNG